MPAFVAFSIVPDLSFATGPAGDDGQGAGPTERAPERVGVIALVGEQVRARPMRASSSDAAFRSATLPGVSIKA